MSDPIKVGDTVMVVKPARCCGVTSDRKSFVVAELSPPASKGSDWVCGTCFSETAETIAIVQGREVEGYELSRLIKLSGPATELGEEEYVDLPLPVDV